MKNKETLIKEKVLRYCQVHLKLLDKKDFIIGDYMGNYKCHFNSVHRATIDKKLGVVLVIAFDGDGYPIVHFINKKGDKFIDNTWGYQYTWGDYYFIKEIHPNEYDKVGVILGDTKEEIIHQCFNTLERFFYKIGDDEI